MNEDLNNKSVAGRIEMLHQQRKEILALAPNKALERILSAPEPAVLVQSFSEQDFHFLVHDIGPEDALPILSLASDSQREYILDMEAWQRDRIDISAVSQWFNLLFRAGGSQTIHWLVTSKTELLEYFLRYKIDVRIREHDQDPADFGEGYFSFDNTFFIKLLEDPSADDDLPSDPDQESAKLFLTRLVEGLADFDHITFQKILLESLHMIPAESEEEEYRLRGVRLAEKGFLPFDEAVGIYQPLKPADISKRALKHVASPAGDVYARTPLYPSGLLEEDSVFTQAMTRVETETGSLALQSEFAGLCNQIVTADHRIIRSKEDLAEVVKKACGYLNIGLQTMADDHPSVNAADTNRFPAFIQRHQLVDLFRIGFGRALALKWQTQRWLDTAWFSNQGLSLTFWGEEWMGVLGGLLIKKPLFFDNYATGRMYREFQTSRDISTTSQLLADVMAFDNLLSLMDIQIETLKSYRFLTYKNLLLTLWASSRTGRQGDLQPLELAAFTAFFNSLWEGSSQTDRRIRSTVKEDFLRWLAEMAGLDQEQISADMAGRLEALFDEVQDECGRISAEDLDPRFIHLFLLEK